MPSPFPGMDPYLEQPTLWPDVHTTFINVTREVLSRALRPRYFVQIEERLYVTDENDEALDLIVPDLGIRAATAPATGGSVAAAPITAPGIEVDARNSLTLREERLSILDPESQEVITVLEFLSPANKVRGSAGRREYESKKEKVLRSTTHLVEIDLLRAGLPLYRRAGAPASDYMVQIWKHEVEGRRRWIWPTSLEAPLPVVPIPLRAGEADVPLDLQFVVNTSYERAGYDVRIDYTKTPVPPLTPEQAGWASRLLSERKS